MTVRGVVKGNVVVLDENVKLPEGTTVEVRVLEAAMTRDEAFARVLESAARNAGLRVGMDEIIEEDRREREEHWDTWMARDP